jgi:2-polyprenyl-6-hydroxyphenyl methylase/3-demethylubiquinone-9 3-methyltransferase
VIEHVADAERFVSSLAALVRPGGMLVLSTLNRTPTSYMLAVVAAEHVLRWVPRGTHEVGTLPHPFNPSRLLESRPKASARLDLERSAGRMVTESCGAVHGSVCLGV